MKNKLVISGTGDTYEGENISKLLDTAARHRIGNLDLWYPKNTRVAGLDRSIDAIRQSGAQVVCISSWTHLYLPGDVTAQQTLLIRAIELAHQLGANLANTYFGHGPVRDDELAISTYIENLKPCLERAAELNVTICLENEFDVLGDDPNASDITRRPESIKALVERVDSPFFKTTFDACNFYFAGVEPFPYAYDILQDTVGYVHLKDGTIYCPSCHPADFLRFTDHSGEYVCLAVGQGAINTRGLLTRLIQDGYQGYYALEPHVEEKRMDGMIQQSLSYLQKSILNEQIQGA